MNSLSICSWERPCPADAPGVDRTDCGIGNKTESRFAGPTPWFRHSLHSGAAFCFHLAQSANNPKLNWTGPVWLAALPLIAHLIVLRGQGLGRSLSIFSSRIWKPTLIALPLFYGGFLSWLHFGTGWSTMSHRMPLPIAWEEMARRVEEIEAPLEEQSQRNLIVVGMDKYSISSEMAFYDLDGDGMGEMSGQHLFGENSLMWASWKPTSAAKGSSYSWSPLEKMTSETQPWISTSKKWIRSWSRQSSRTAVRWAGFYIGWGMDIEQTTLRSPPYAGRLSTSDFVVCLVVEAPFK